MQLRVLEDGTPIFESYSRLDGIWIFRGLDGKRIGDQPTLAPTVYLNGPAARNEEINSAPTWTERVRPIIRSTSRHDEMWYLMQTDAQARHGYLVGYDADTNRPIGFIGRDGFRETEPVDDRQFVFDPHVSLDSRIVYLPFGTEAEKVSDKFDCPSVVTAEGLVGINLRTKSIKVAWKRGLISAHAFQSNPQAKNEPPDTILLRTTDEVLTLDRRASVGDFPSAAQLQLAFITWTPTAKQRAVAYSLSDKSELFWIDAATKDGPPAARRFRSRISAVRCKRGI